MKDPQEGRREPNALRDTHRNGAPQAMEELIPLIYDELRRLAHKALRREWGSSTLNTTELVHEAYLNLSGGSSHNWPNQAEFLKISAHVMGEVLIQHARKRTAKKRDPGIRTDIDPDNLPLDNDLALLIHEALKELKRADEDQAMIVKLFYYGGLTTEEVAKVMSMSPSTVKRHWAFARAWLRRHINDERR